jgi:peptide/nickel transport system permease protein
MVGLCLLAAVFAPALAPYGPNEKTSAPPLAPPSADHWLGTGPDGYDVLSRVLYGGRLSLLAGGVSIGLAVLVGVSVGVAAGYAGGWTDALAMRGIDLVLSFPGILIAILVVLASDRASWTPIMVAVGVINIPVFARQVRATVLTVRSLDYVVASEAMGASSAHVLGRVILPAVVSPVIVLATLGLGTAVLEVAGLSFLGIAGQPDDPEWGTMLAVAKNFLAASFWPALAPGAAISLTVLGFNLLGDGLRDALDPRGGIED